MDNKAVNTDNIEYTIVMDPSFTLTGGQGKEQNSGGRTAGAAGNSVDTLYAEYERMCLKSPTMLDTDDVYPHTYQWRIIDRYDPAKTALLKKALEEGMKIADLDAYQEFLEDVSKRSIGTDAWE